MGKFISRDPIGIADDVNLYGYVGNSPVMFVDRMGTKKELISGNIFSGEDISTLFLEFMNQANQDINKMGIMMEAFYLVESRPRGAYDIKRIDNFKEYEYKKNGVLTVDFNGTETTLPELGNYLLGYNGYYAGISLPSITNIALGTEIYLKKTSVEGLGDEIRDQSFYEAGFNFARNEYLGLTENNLEEVTNSIFHAQLFGTVENLKYNNIIYGN